ncbi:MAG: ECF transporter S component [Herbiconiux sp.]|nr:ECF transporter S component [Herbiconiux sp.]
MKRASTAYLLTCAVLGVAGGLLLAPANWASTVLFATVPFAGIALAGLWLLPAVVALRLLLRPGAGLLVGLISGLVLAPFSGYGFSTVATNLWWAFFAEIGFLLVAYRFWTVWQHLAGAVVVGIAYPLLAREAYGLDQYTPVPQGVFFALTLGSCLAGTAVGLLVARSLRRAGVGAAARRRPVARAAAGHSVADGSGAPDGAAADA